MPAKISPIIKILINEQPPFRRRKINERINK